jgi:hypothetical protein
MLASDGDSASSVLSDNEEIQVASEIESIFESVDRPGDFSVGGMLTNREFSLPGIKIKSSEDFIALPLNKNEANQIISVASKSPFGRGEETVLDDNIRKSWQLDPSQFDITNPNWNTALSELLETIKQGLGIVPQTISCTLYKLLLYEEGGHFKPHKDTEKEEQMFGTLIIQLPCSYSGGDIVVLHNRETNRFSFSKEAPFCTYYTAFYADCEHEIESVTSGYRLCLIYNLIYRGVTAPEVMNRSMYLDQLQKVHNLWVDTYDQSETPNKLIYVLEHQYSHHGLGFQNLKGQDSYIADLLLNASKQGLFKIFLAILTKTEHGHNNDDYHSGTHMDEVDDVTITITNIVDTNNISLNQRINVSESDIFPKDRFENLRCAGKESEGPTGNEGVSINKWYKSAVLWFYPVEKEWDIVLSCYGTQHALTYLRELIDEGDGVEFAKTIARTVVKYNNTVPTSEFFEIITEEMDENDELIALYIDNQLFSYEYSLHESIITRMLKQLITVLDMEDSWKRFGDAITNALKKQKFKLVQALYDRFKVLGQDSPLLPVLFQCLFHTFQNPDANRFYEPDHMNVERAVEWTCVFHNNKFDMDFHVQRLSQTKDLLTLIQFIDKLSQKLQGVMKEPPYNVLPQAALNRMFSSESNAKQLLSYFTSLPLLHISANDFIDKIIESSTILLIEKANLVFLLSEKRTMMTLQGYRTLLDFCIQVLESKGLNIPVAVEPGWDHDDKVTLPCTCQNCSYVQHYLNNPQSEEIRFAKPERDRSHVQYLLRNFKYISMHTEKAGSPYTLVIKKHVARIPAEVAEKRRWYKVYMALVQKRDQDNQIRPTLQVNTDQRPTKKQKLNNSEVIEID